MKIFRRFLLVAIIGAGLVFVYAKFKEFNDYKNISEFLKTEGFEGSNSGKSLGLDEHLADLEDSEIILVNFWARWCAPCVAELKDFSELSARFPQKDIKIIAVGEGENNEDIGAFIKKQKIRAHNIIFLPDEDMSIGERLNINYLPVTLVADNAGKLITGVMGIRPWARSDYKNFLRYLIINKKLPE